jgi:hypothetical protein
MCVQARGCVDISLFMTNHCCRPKTTTQTRARTDAARMWMRTLMAGYTVLAVRLATYSISIFFSAARGRAFSRCVGAVNAR